jgi:DNA-binding transcriptional MerR regulator
VRRRPAPRGARAPEPTLPGIPDKEYFRIGEAARLVGVKPYVLRYWESEFKRDIRPERSRSNQRMYRRRDLETFLEIKRLRYEEKLELPGARRRLRSWQPEEALPDLPDGLPDAPSAPAGAEAASPASPASPASVDRLRAAVAELLRIVDEDEKAE